MSVLIRTSEASSLALHAIALLAASSDELVTRGQISELLDCSEAHLTKVLQRLTKVGLVSSTRGPSGGFKLNRPGEQIRLIEIYEAIEGRLVPLKCLLARPVCDGSSCVLGGLLAKVNQETYQYLADTTVRDVANTHGIQMLREKFQDLKAGRRSNSRRTPGA